jgi:hypothetical protein
MKKAILSAVLILTFTVCMSQSKEKNQSKTISKQEMAAKLSADYAEYFKETITDSTLQVYYVYTGKERPEIKQDTTIVKGKTFKVMTIIPTVQYQWLKRTTTHSQTLKRRNVEKLQT